MITIREADLNDDRVMALLSEHLREMRATSPPGSVHALDLSGLSHSSVTLWGAWEGEMLLGCGALKQLDATHAEIKSMRTATAHRRRGVAGLMLTFLMDEAVLRGYFRLSLETGSMQAFAPARALYAGRGFTMTEPFADYSLDPNSVFMTVALTTRGDGWFYRFI